MERGMEARPRRPRRGQAMTHITWDKQGRRLVDGKLAPEHQRPLKDGEREALARKLCEIDGEDPNYLEPGDVLGVDGINHKGEQCHFFWREYL